MRTDKTGLCRGALVGAVLLAFFCLQAGAQTSAAQSRAEQKGRVPARVTETVDDTNRTVLRGNVHPLARAEFDRGAVADAQPVTRMLLLLQRSAEQEAALQQLMEEQQAKNSSNYHAWLTPDEFGKKFGPADADVRAVTDWLTSHGFQVRNVSKGRTVIEFSGSAGQVRSAFGTEIHKYNVKGEEHFANASEPQIPAALAPVARGVVALHNFRPKSFLHNAGTFRRNAQTGEVKPAFTFSDTNGTFYALGPADFAKIYNIPSTATGAGQSIAIVGQSNINLSDVAAFRSIFGLTANVPQVILNGPDPGLVSGDETESDLDVEWSGAVAPQAQIIFVTSETAQTDFLSGVDASALYIVDNNLAPVLSESYGSCEAGLGTTGNAFYNSMWQQAAAEGITVVIAAGDSGSAGCDPGAPPANQNAATQGLAISGFASTPFNVALGGTDFDDANNQATFWNTGNTAGSQLSAKGYIPEIPWNDSCASTAKAGSISGICSTVNNNGLDIVAGSGGSSKVYTGSLKPSWQVGFGDVNRDIPDVSLFASNGGPLGAQSKSMYIVCESDQDIAGDSGCSLTKFSNSAPFHDFQGVGGTSASTPAFAGIVALVNQKTGQRQGNVNYVLYALGKSENFAGCNSSAFTNPTVPPPSTCVFQDVTKGNISVACAGGSSGCSNTTSGQFGILAQGTTPAFNTAIGYDLATGLGSVNVNNLLSAWAAAAASRTASVTTLSSSTTFPIAHGVPASFTVSVTPSTVTGDISLIATLPGVPVTHATVGPFTLVNGTIAFSTNLLPGGAYPVIAHYEGNGTFGASDSSAVNVNVTSEASKTALSFVTFNASNTPTFQTGNVTVAYGSPYVLRVDVTNSSGTKCASGTTPVARTSIPCPTGKVTLTDNGSGLNDFSGGDFTTLNNQGFLEDQPIQLPVGTHGIAASYAGDSSYGPSASAAGALSVKITVAATSTVVTPSPTSVAKGGNVTLTATVNTNSSGAGPSGTVQFKNGSSNLGSAMACTPTSGIASTTGNAFCTATLTTALSEIIPMTRPERGPRIWLMPLGLVAWIALLLLILAKQAVRLPRKWTRLGYAAAGLLLFAWLAAGMAGCSGLPKGGSGGGGGGGSGNHTDSITAVYSGDTNYTGSTSAVAPVTIQ